MDFKQLESFVAIGKLKSFSKAAGRLFLTQPTLSNHIARLEEELGVTLFTRNNKKTELTAAGQSFFLSAQEILNRREAAVLDLAGFCGKIEGCIEIGASSIPAQYLLPPLLTRFHAQYPDVSYNLRYLNSGRVIGNILAGELDFGFVGSSPANPLLVYEQMAEDELVAIAPLREPYVSMQDISLTELTQCDLLLRQEGSGTRQAFEEALKQHLPEQPPLKIVAHMDNDEMINLAVMAGLGLAVVSNLAVADKARFGLLKILPLRGVELKRRFWFVYPQGRILSPLVTRFRDFVLGQGTKDS